jgi:hypothetical protein
MVAPVVAAIAYPRVFFVPPHGSVWRPRLFVGNPAFSNRNSCGPNMTPGIGCSEVQFAVPGEALALLMDPADHRRSSRIDTGKCGEMTAFSTRRFVAM